MGGYMFRPIGLLIVAFFILFFSARGQTFTSLPQADSVTYRLYLQEQWKALTETGTHVLKDGIDFYYLRVRMGVAYFKLGNYQRAIAHFEKALADNPSDAFVMEYLYYARLYAGRRAEALYEAGNFSEALKQYTGTEKPKWVRQIDVVYNQNFVENSSAIDNFKTSGIPAGENGAQFISDGHQYFFLGLKHELSRTFSYYHAYTGLSKDHFVYVQEEGVSSVNRQARATLNQYFGTAQWRVAKNLQWLGGLHYVHISNQQPVVQTSQGRDRIVWVEGSRGERVLFTGLAAQVTGVNALLMVHDANLNGRKQFQADAQVTVYPLGNLNFYLSGQVSFQKEKLGETSRNATVFEPLAGGKISNRLWLEAYGAFGPQQNYIGSQGAVLFNTADRITSRMGARLHIFPASRLRVQLEGVWLQQESSFELFESLSPVYNTIPFKSYSVTGGISWYF
jgi:hypothetical protein